MIDLICGDSLEELKKLPENSIDSIVTDPPYGLSAPRNSGKTSKGGFMGKKWDYDVPQVELWRECLRALKPGGHMLAFAGTRTQHRMAVNIEDAGFEIRDVIAWHYASGFPKSLNIGKAIDKRKDWDIYDGFSKKIKRIRDRLGLTKRQAFEKCNFTAKTFGGNSWFEDGRIPSLEDYKLIKLGLDLDSSFDELFKNVQRELLSKERNWGNAGHIPVSGYGTFEVTKGASIYEGWGTALKPAMEMISVCRKPLSEKTIAANVLKWGTCGINIDDSRVGNEERFNASVGNKSGGNSLNMSSVGMPENVEGKNVTGRWPANLIHDGSDEVVDNFPHTKNSGSAARFFYCAKSSKVERGEGNNHPTVKPLKLMQYLTKLVTPPDGTVLDPFMGSGTTGVACANNDFDFVGIEIDTDYVEIARSRIGSVKA